MSLEGRVPETFGACFGMHWTEAHDQPAYHMGIRLLELLILRHRINCELLLASPHGHWHKFGG